MKKLATALALTTSMSVSAALEDHGVFFKDTETGFDWRKIADTKNQSFDQVASRIVAGDLNYWRYADYQEVQGLLQGRIGRILSIPGMTTWIHFRENLTLRESYGIVSDSQRTGERGVVTLNGIFDHRTSVGIYSIGLNTAASQGPIAEYSRNLVAGSFLVRPSLTEVPIPASGFLFISAIISIFCWKRGEVRQAVKHPTVLSEVTS